MRPYALAALTILSATSLVAQDADAGRALFLKHCATCHGAEALGNGPMAPSLLVQPSDLTTLKQRNLGVTPVIRIVSRIDGRDPLVAHGSQMPVYGDFFEGDDTFLKAETGQPIMTSRSIADLLAWLETVQR